MEKDKKFIVTGQIIVKEDRSGVFGLSVSIFDKDLLFDDLLGTATTDEDGRFTLIYQEKDFSSLFEKAPDLYVKVLDCREEIVFSSEDAVRWNADQKVNFAIEIQWFRLASHINNLRPLARLTGGMAERSKLEKIKRAIELLENRIHCGLSPKNLPGAPLTNVRPTTAHSAAYCPVPDILVFKDLLDIAWAVIDNDVPAVPRFLDVLDTLIYRKNVRKPDQVAAVRQRWFSEEPTETEVLQDIVDAKREMLPLAPAHTIIETDRILPVLAAAVIAAGGDSTVENRFLSFLVGEVNALSQSDVVYRAAREALLAPPAGLNLFQELLAHIGGTGGPDDGPVPWPPEPADFWAIDDILRLEQRQCTAEMANAVRNGVLHSSSYTINDIKWDNDCPGAPVIITGENLSGVFPDSQRVLFTHRTGWGTVQAATVDPGLDWTESRIKILLPEEAGPGPISLHIIDNFVTACGRGIPVCRRGDTAEFTGGAPYIRVFSANDRQGEFRINAGETVMLRWLVVPADAEVRLLIRRNGDLIEDREVDAESELAVVIPADTPSDIVCTLTADNSCPAFDTGTITLHAPGNEH